MKASHRITILFILIVSITSCGKKGSTENDQQTEQAVVELSPEEFKSKLSSTPDAVLIDVRKPEEVEEGMIQGAMNIDYSNSGFTESIDSLDDTKTYFLYCKTAKRSTGAAEKMKQLGFQKIFVLQGGINNWQNDGQEVVQP
jgi:rhodanese-related sulfurtransferase